MGRYVVRRVLQLIPVFFGATFLIFAMVFALPGDPIRALADNDAYPFFEALDDLIVTGPTGTNVMDLALVMVD